MPEGMPQADGRLLAESGGGVNFGPQTVLCSLPKDDALTSSFNALRDAVIGAVTLAHYDSSKLICLYTDASQHFWSAVITQISKEDLPKPHAERRHEPLYFLSGSFKNAALRWAIVDKEAFPIMHAIKTCSHLF